MWFGDHGVQKVGWARLQSKWLKGIINVHKMREVIVMGRLHCHDQ